MRNEDTCLQQGHRKISTRSPRDSLKILFNHYRNGSKRTWWQVQYLYSVLVLHARDCRWNHIS